MRFRTAEQTKLHRARPPFAAWATALAFASLTALTACENEGATSEPDDVGSDVGAVDTFNEDADLPPPRALPTSAPVEPNASVDDDPDSLVFLGAGGGEAIRITRSAPEQVRAGELFEYQLRVENISNLTARDVVVHESLPPGLQVRSPDGRHTRQDGAARGAEAYRVGTLPAGGSRTIAVQAVARSEGEVPVCVSVDFDQAFCTTMEVVKPELRLRRLVPDRPLYVCDDVEVTYVLTNTGTGQTNDAVIVEDLPEGLSYEGGRRIELAAGNLAAGESVEKTVILNASAPLDYTGSAQARTGKLSVRSQDGAVQIVQPDIELSIDGPRQHYVGWPATYHLTVRNTGDVPAVETTLRVPIIDQAPRVSFSSNAQRDGDALALGRIDPGQSRTVDISFTREEPADLTIGASARAYCADAVQTELRTSFEGIPALRLEVVDLRDPVPVGEHTIYQVQVKNQGSAEDVNVRLSANLPESMTFVRGGGDSRVTADAQSISFEPIQSLPPQGIASWRIEVNAAQAGDATFQVQLTSDAHANPIREEEPTNLYQP